MASAVWGPGGIPAPLQPAPSRVLPPFLRLLLVPWTLQLAGGITVTHTDLPIRVSLANTDMSFSCKIHNFLATEIFMFTVSFFYVDIHGEKSSEKPIACQPRPGMENQTMDCMVQLSLPNASATGTYYCQVKGHVTSKSDGIFILVRDTGYQPPSFKVQEALLLSFTGLLSVLGVLGTALLFWKKKQIAALGKHTAKTCPGPKPTIGTTKPPAESIYTSLQRRETEVYACIEGETGSPVSSQSSDTKGKMNRVEDDREFNLVYENL